MSEIITDGYQYRGAFVSRVVNTVIGLIELLLLARIVLELLGANSSAPIVAWVYNVSGAFMGPFVGAFPGVQFGYNSMLDIVAIVAMVGYAILGWIIVELFYFIFGTVSGL